MDRVECLATYLATPLQGWHELSNGHGKFPCSQAALSQSQHVVAQSQTVGQVGIPTCHPCLPLVGSFCGTGLDKPASFLENGHALIMPLKAHSSALAFRES